MSANVLERPHSVALTRGARPTMPGAFWRLYRSEMRLIVRRRRNIVLLAVLGVVPLLIGTAIKLSHPGRDGGPAFLGQVSENGLFLIFTTLAVSIPVFFPLVIGVVAGDSIAGEAGSGTLRYLLTVPVTRTRLLVVKALSLLSFTALSVLVVVVVGLVVGGFYFGVHNVTLLSGNTLSLGGGLLRTLSIGLFVTIALFGLAAVGIFISTLTENAIPAMAATIGFALITTVLDTIPQLSGIHPLLLTHNWLKFGEFLRDNVRFADIVQWLHLPLAYAAIFLTLAWARLRTKDITS